MNADPLLTISFWVGTVLIGVGLVTWLLSLAIKSKKVKETSEGIMLMGFVITIYFLFIFGVGAFEFTFHGDQELIVNILKKASIL